MTNSIGKGILKITDTNLYVLIVTLSTEDNTKLLQQLKLGFKRIINWSKSISGKKSQYLDYFIDLKF